MSVGMPAHLKLERFGDAVCRAFGERPYLVGSALAGKDWRDVDVRLILDDDDFAARFGDRTSARWAVMCEAFAALGREMTGLPIDFQIQPVTHANETFDGPRGALGLLYSQPAPNCWTAPRPLVHPRNVAGCCDGTGQVHHGFGALSSISLCHDRECMARREAEFDAWWDGASPSQDGTEAAR